jgi:hypothetical protein
MCFEKSIPTKHDKCADCLFKYSHVAYRSEFSTACPFERKVEPLKDVYCAVFLIFSSLSK